MSSSYSRDPNDLLLHPSKNELFAPPMNYLDAKNSGVQPVIYRNAILKQPLADFETGTELPILQIDWRKGQINIFRDDEDMLNGVPWEHLHNYRVLVPPEPMEQYVWESVQFLQRGHSLLDPFCTCSHGLSPSRARRLGITASSERMMQICPLRNVPKIVSFNDLSMELGIEDITTFSIKGQGFLDSLQRHCTIQRNHDPSQCIIACTSLYMGGLRNKENLIAKIKSHKLPFDLELHKYTKEYPGLLNDIQSLEAEGFVHVIEHDRDRGKIILHFLDPERRLKVDADIRALWHSVDISREMKKRPRPTDE